MTSTAFVDVAGWNVVVGVSGWNFGWKYYNGGPHFPMFELAPLCLAGSVGQRPRHIEGQREWAGSAPYKMPNRC